jgi:bifunctional ADP-heptose synthase (sugar kinase/adenylyltransferase)
MSRNLPEASAVRYGLIAALIAVSAIGAAKLTQHELDRRNAEMQAKPCKVVSFEEADSGNLVVPPGGCIDIPLDQNSGDVEEVRNLS